jgi:tyrosine decarboxylase/aspartate 1-decarboxylase
VTQYLGVKGYEQLAKEVMDLTQYAVKKLHDIGLELVMEPTLNVITVKVNKLNQIVDTLTNYGWKVNKVDHLSGFRIVIMPQITQSVIDEFILILKRTCNEVKEL